MLTNRVIDTTHSSARPPIQLPPLEALGGGGQKNRAYFAPLDFFSVYTLVFFVENVSFHLYKTEPSAWWSILINLINISVLNKIG